VTTHRFGGSIRGAALSILMQLPLRFGRPKGTFPPPRTSLYTYRSTSGDGDVNMAMFAATLFRSCSQGTGAYRAIEVKTGGQ
jgi:hypothetical protein